MRFVEAVACELLHEIENCLGQRGIDIASHCAIGKQAALLLHHRGVFFAHCLTENICAAQGVVAQHLRDLHHLLLIENDAVGIGQNRL